VSSCGLFLNFLLLHPTPHVSSLLFSSSQCFLVIEEEVMHGSPTQPRVQRVNPLIIDVNRRQFAALQYRRWKEDWLCGFRGMTVWASITQITFISARQQKSGSIEIRLCSDPNVKNIRFSLLMWWRWHGDAKAHLMAAVTSLTKQVSILDQWNFFHNLLQ